MTVLQWQRSIEQIILTSAGQGKRVIGLASIQGKSGVGLVAHDLARTLSAGGSATLRIDASGLFTPGTEAHAWTPRADRFRPFITSTTDGYDFLCILSASSAGNPAHGSASIPILKEHFADELSNYQRVIIELPYLREPPSTALNPLTFAIFCDPLLLICGVGRDRVSELRSAVKMLASVGVKISGVIANQHYVQ